MDIISPRIHEELYRARDLNNYWETCAERVHWQQRWQQVLEPVE